MTIHRLKSVEPIATEAKSASSLNVTQVVAVIIEEIRTQGDAAVRRYSEKFDQWSPRSFKLSEEEIQGLIASLDPQTVEDIKQVQSNVRTFAIAQRDSLKEFELEIRPGVFLGQKNNPIESVGW
jgi:histidinol dehydrogenase